MDNPNYYSILTANVRYNQNLSDKAKILFSEITALSNKYGYCNATNGYFENLYNTSSSTIKRMLVQLQDENVIIVKIERIHNKGTYRKIYPVLNSLGGVQICTPDSPNLHPQKNNTSNNKENETKVTRIEVSTEPRKKYFAEDKRTAKQLPFDLVTSSQSLRALYDKDSDELRQLVKDCFKIESTHEEISDCINSFCTVAIATNEDDYKDYKDIRDFEVLKAKFFKWIPTHLKYAEQYPKKYKPKKIKRKNDYKLKDYYQQVLKEKHFKQIESSGELKEDETLFSAEFENLLSISANYNNETFTPFLIFECLYKQLGRFLSGSTPKRKEAALLRFMGKLNDYNQNKGDIRQLLKQAAEKDAL